MTNSQKKRSKILVHSIIYYQTNDNIINDAKFKLESGYFMFWVGLIIGLMVGGMIGVTILALMIISKDDSGDDE